MSNINLFAELDEDQGQAHGHNNGYQEHKDDDLIVFGYSCKLFRDDFSAKAIDRGQSLIPWNGDENVMIDRCAQIGAFLSFVLFSFRERKLISIEDICLVFSSFSLRARDT